MMSERCFSFNTRGRCVEKYPLLFLTASETTSDVRIVLIIKNDFKEVSFL